MRKQKLPSTKEEHLLNSGINPDIKRNFIQNTFQR